MKKKILLFASFCLLTIFQKGTAQTLYSNPNASFGYVTGNSSISTVHNLFNPSVAIGGRTTANGGTNYNNTSWIQSHHHLWMTAIDAACASWAQILGSPYQLEFEFHSDAEGPAYALPTTDALAAGGGTRIEYGGLPFPDVWYAGALALYVGGPSAVTSTTATQIEVNIKDNPGHSGWYTGADGACGADQYDMYSIIMHEIGHSIGFSSATANGGTATPVVFNNIIDNHPNIFDEFIDDNGTGSMSSTVTQIVGLVSGSADLTSFANGTGNYAGDPTGSNNAFFDGPIAGLQSLYLPPIFKNGASLSHLDPASSPDALMTPEVGLHWVNHCPQTYEVYMLEDIGWAESSIYSVGFTDYLTLSPKPGVLDIGSSATTFTASCVYGSPVGTVNWDIDLYCADGTVVTGVLTGISSCGLGTTSSWSPNITLLPSGHRWLRDINGRVQGRLSITNSFGFRPTSIDIGVNAAPEQPIFDITNVSIENCANPILGLYDPGASSYVIYVRNNFGGSYSPFWNAFPYTPGASSYQFPSSLDQTLSYQFYVVGVNATGSSVASSILTRGPCSWTLALTPNPVAPTSTLSIAVSDPGFLVTHVAVVNVESGMTYINATFDGSVSTVSLNLSQYSLPSGVYAVNVYDDNGDMASAQLQTAY